VNLREFGEIFEYNIEHNIKQSLMGIGPTGIGKSQLVRTLGRKHGYTVVDFRFAQMNEDQIAGLICPNAAKTKTIMLMPETMPDDRRDGGKTVLLLDDISSCSKKAQAAVYELILDRRMGQYKLPAGTFVVALGNTEDFTGDTQFTGMFSDRFELHIIEPDLACWKADFAKANGIHRLVMNYLGYNPAAFYTGAEKNRGIKFATPRSWEKVSDILKLDEDINKPVIRNKILGNLGQEEGRKFLDYCTNSASRVTVEEYMTGKKKAPVSAEEIAVLTRAMVENVRFVEKAGSMAELSQPERELVARTVRAFFGFSRAEYIVTGYKRLRLVNAQIAKEALLLIEDENIKKFIHNNSTMFML